MLVHCEARMLCGNEECMHYESHDYNEAEGLTRTTKSGNVYYVSPCQKGACRYIGRGGCECIPVGDEEDIE